MHRVNYDEIAHLYDEPYRHHQVDAHLLAFLASKPTIAPSQVRVLDVGCGTGKQLSANRTLFPGMYMVGLDRFRRMLEIARKTCPSVMWIQGDGTELPFASASFDYACNQFSYQHIRNKEKLLTELYRVLKTGGRFVMTNIDPWSMTGWSVYRYFPEALELDRRDFLPVERFVALMKHTGFRDVHIERSEIEKRESLRDFLAYASERHRASQLMAISDAAYRSGIRRLTEEALKVEGQDRLVEFEFVWVAVTGDKTPYSPRR